MKRLRWPRWSVRVIKIEILILVFAVAAFVFALLYHGNSFDIGAVSAYVAVFGAIAAFAATMGKRIQAVVIATSDRPAAGTVPSTVVLSRWSVIAIISVIGLVIAGLSVSAGLLFAAGPEEPGTTASVSLKTPKASGRNTPNTPALPPGFTRTDCIYNVDGQPKEPHDIQPGGWIEQEFVAAEPYISSLSVNIGINPARSPGRTTGLIRLDLLDGDKQGILYHAGIHILNNEFTTFQFSPSPVRPGRRYWMRVVNTSKFVISPYMRDEPGPEGKPRKPPDAKRTLVYGEVNRDDVPRKDVALVGCVKGAQRR